MKTITVTVSDDVAARIDAHAAENKRSAEDMAARALEDAYAPDWFDDIEDEDRADIKAGVAEADRGEFAADTEVDEAYARFKR